MDAATLPATDTVLVVGTKLRLSRFRDIPGFLVASTTVSRQARRSPGFVGLRLRAQFRSRHFWTVTAWRDEASMIAFVRTDPHRGVMRRFARRMESSTSARWWSPASGGVPGWDVVARWLDQPDTV